MHAQCLKETKHIVPCFPHAQAPLLQAMLPSILQALSDAAGLYGFCLPPRHDSGDLESTNSHNSHNCVWSADEDGEKPADFWPQVAHQTVLHALFAVLGLSYSTGVWLECVNVCM